MSASFRINQAGITGGKPPVGTLDRARQDLDLSTLGGPVTFEAVAGATTYSWEILSRPEGSSAVLSSPAAQTTAVSIDVTGGYLVCLTIDEALITEDVLTLYFGVALESSGLAIPAFNEVDFDNSMAPYDASYGFERKLTAFLKWCDARLGEEIYEVYPPRDKVDVATSSVLDTADTGKIHYLDDGVVATLPPAEKGLHYYVYCSTYSSIKPNLLCDGADIFWGGYLRTWSTWTRIELDDYTGIHIVCAETPGGLGWFIHGGAGIIRNALNTAEDWIISFNVNDVPYLQLGVPVISQGLTTGTHVLETFPYTERQSAKWRYTVKNTVSGDIRIGHVVATWKADGTFVAYSDTVESESGGASQTSAVTFTVDESGGNIRLNMIVASGTWDFDAVRTDM